MTTPTRENFDLAEAMLIRAEGLMSASSAAFLTTTAGNACAFADTLIALAQQILAPVKPTATPAKADARTCKGCGITDGHTDECRFQHFLAYSGLHGCSPAVLDLMFRAFTADKDKL
ncbi:hypothetical protein [Pseudomonas sp.]|uniref:hypothetical protein n=1 Tax=Pseudomonas sp. TaxID=306 RepID=UPI003FD6C4F3